MCPLLVVFVGAYNNSTVDFGIVTVIRSFWIGFTLDPYEVADTMLMIFVTEKNWRRSTSLF